MGPSQGGAVKRVLKKVCVVGGWVGGWVGG